MSSQPYDFKSDMWSLGCCLYEMMSLKHAFDASDMNSLVLKIMRGQHLPISQQVRKGVHMYANKVLFAHQATSDACARCARCGYRSRISLCRNHASAHARHCSPCARKVHLV